MKICVATQIKTKNKIKQWMKYESAAFFLMGGHKFISFDLIQCLIKIL